MYYAPTLRFQCDVNVEDCPLQFINKIKLTFNTERKIIEISIDYLNSMIHIAYVCTYPKPIHRDRCRGI